MPVVFRINEPVTLVPLVKFHVQGPSAFKLSSISNKTADRWEADAENVMFLRAMPDPSVMLIEGCGVIVLSASIVWRCNSSDAGKSTCKG